MTNDIAHIYRRWRDGDLDDDEARELVGDEFDEFARLKKNDEIVARTPDVDAEDDELFFTMTDDLTRAIELYEREDATLGQAARLAGIDRWTLRDELVERGVEFRLGLEDEDDAKCEVEQPRDLFTDDDEGEFATPSMNEYLNDNQTADDL